MAVVLTREYGERIRVRWANSVVWVAAHPTQNPDSDGVHLTFNDQILTKPFDERVKFGWGHRAIWVLVKRVKNVNRVKLVFDGDIKDLEILREELLTDKQVKVAEPTTDTR